jgi:hypothetical protein
MAEVSNKSLKKLAKELDAADVDNIIYKRLKNERRKTSND